METKTISAVDRFVNWFQRSITIKLISIGFLLLILLLPSSWVESLMQERQARAGDVVNEISEKWSGPQTIAGPILVIPYDYIEKVENDRHETTLKTMVGKAFFLPEDLAIDGTVTPQTLHRGIFDAVVYDASVKLKAQFKKPDFSGWNIDPTGIHWSEAYLVFGISDLRGIHDNPVISAGDSSIASEPSADIGVDYGSLMTASSDSDSYPSSNSSDDKSNYKGIIARLPQEMTTPVGEVSITVNLKGSSSLSFVPAGKTTSTTLAGPWGSPSFDGAFLPQSRELTDDSFSANWKVLQFNRAFEARWTDTGRRLGDANFGAQFLPPVDQYQKSIRTSKYSILIILLTFVALLLVEIAHKTRIHPFQYTLIGAALIVYYTLLLSVAEQVGFNWAYWIASMATTALIGIYSISFFRKSSLSVLLSSLLGIFYLFIFVIVIQQDLSLLIGSIGLFMVVALLMYFSRKINWYREETEVAA